MDWDELIYPGQFRARSGEIVDITPDDLAYMIDTFDPNDRDVPIVLGHPEHNHPAYGWLDRLRINPESGYLEGKYKDLVEALIPMLKQKQYRKKSIGLYPDKRLKHIGLLGAAQPAVPGLSDIKFNQNQDSFVLEVIEFSEGNMTIEELQALLAAKEKELEAAKAKQKEFSSHELQSAVLKLENKLSEKEKEMEAARKKMADKDKAFSEYKGEQERKELEQWVDGQIAQGKILPAQKENGMLDFMCGLGSIEFSQSGDGQKTNPKAWFKEFVEGLPSHGLFHELGKPEGRTEDLTGLTETF
jgi:DNA-binding transcriptional MerR regulator